MKLTAQISDGVHRDGVHRWSVAIEDVETEEIVCVIISESADTAELNAAQIFKLLSQIAHPGADLSPWPKKLQ